MKPTTRIILQVCGTLCVVLAVIGMFLPILPTTPFLLLASFCYARSSKRLENWLLSNRWFGEYIKNYRAGLGLPLKHKLLSLLLLWLTIGYAAWVASFWWLKLILLAIALGVSYHLLTIRTYRPDLPPTKPFQAAGSPEGSE